MFRKLSDRSNWLLEKKIPSLNFQGERLDWLKQIWRDRIMKNITPFAVVKGIAAVGVTAAVFTYTGAQLHKVMPDGFMGSRPGSAEPVEASMSDTTSKQIIGVAVIGAANGLYGEGVLSDATLNRAETMASGISPFIRDALSSLEREAENQALRGEWSEASVTAYLDTLSIPAPELEAYKNILISSAKDQGLMAFDQAAAKNHPNLANNQVRWNALTEMVLIDAGYAEAMSSMNDTLSEKIGSLTAMIVSSGVGLYGPETGTATYELIAESFSEDVSGVAKFVKIDDPLFGATPSAESEAALDAANFETEGDPASLTGTDWMFGDPTEGMNEEFAEAGSVDF